MDRKLLDYLPPVLREVLEMQAINEANEPEITLAWDALTLVLANQFLETADVHGVAVWEKELRLRPKDTGTLAERKARIKAAWSAQLPYTLPWLRQWLDGICGSEGHRETVTDYTLKLWLDFAAMWEGNARAEDIVGLLREVLPENLWLELTLSLAMERHLRIGGAMATVTRLPVPER